MASTVTVRRRRPVIEAVVLAVLGPVLLLAFGLMALALSVFVVVLKRFSSRQPVAWMAQRRQWDRYAKAVRSTTAPPATTARARRR
jgi:hypothetical protein